MGKKKRYGRDRSRDPYVEDGPYQQPYNPYAVPGPQYDNAAYYGYGPGDPGNKPYMDDGRGFPIGPFQSLPHPWRDQMYPGPRHYDDDSHASLKDSETSRRERKRKYIVIGAILLVILIAGAIIGSILASTLKDTSAERPQTQQVQVVKSVFGEATMTDKTFTDDLNDPVSPTYKQMEQEFKDMMDRTLANRDDLGGEYNGTIVQGFREGSVVVINVVQIVVSVTVEVSTGTTNGNSDSAGNSGSNGNSDTQVDLDIDLSGVVSAVESAVQNTPGLGNIRVASTDHCDSAPCLNGANCTSGVDSFTCTCNPGYSGQTCATDIDECASAPCQNGGQCFDGIARYTCSCATGFTGDNCETNIDDCVNAGCVNQVRCEDGVSSFTCICQDGWTGTLCNIDIDECSSNPCQNGASCIDGINGYTCSCSDGYEGNNCEIDIDECISNPCQNGGSCTDAINSYTCACVDGFEGNICQTNINDCSPNPCQNGGSCTDGINVYTCACVDGFEGDDCATNINECSPNPCQNGGSCTDGINVYTCACVDGFEGDDCETNINDCSPNPCQNGGSCSDGINTYTCACVDGFEGDDCETNINECSPNPCQNGGSCTDGINIYTCACVDGFEGDDCETNINDCSPNPCQNGGSCSDGINTYTCACVDGFEGDDCETNINECSPNPCQNGGSCTDGINVYTCACVDGFEGDDCETNIDECSSDPCQNGGACTDGINGYTCACADGYEGNICQTNINECSPNPCQNGGSCTDEINGYTCDCLDGFQGNICQTNVDECSSDPCQNGGACADDVNGYTCLCSDGFEGDDCETNIDECSSDPCQNGGACTDGINGYTCNCADGFVGDHCETNIDECSPNPCQNGGLCTDGINTYTCACVDGFEGDDCETNINDCSPNPCQNGGLCTDGIDVYTCACVDGFEGDDCETNIDDCSSDPCLNGGLCLDDINDYTCICFGGYEGKNCEINIDDCNSDPCLNGGSCVDGINDYTCICFGGYEGTNCEINIDDCSSDPCLNGGSCVDGINDYTCICFGGYEGTNCEITITTPPPPTTTARITTPRATPVTTERVQTTRAATTVTRRSTTVSTTSEPSPEPECPEYSFVCDNGTCIPSEWECDGDYDCRFREDELHCGNTGRPTTAWPTTARPTSPRTNSSDTTTRSTTWATTSSPDCTEDDFICYNLSCIPVGWKCDGWPDCNYGEDEFYCNSTTTTARPTTNSSDTTTQSTTWATTSSPGCTEDDFICYDGSCIPGRWQCDGWPDCNYGEDELYCNSTTTTARPTTNSSDTTTRSTTWATTTSPGCADDMFQCWSGYCIRLSWVCDGEDDCYYGEDESSDICYCNGTWCSNRLGCFTQNQYCDGVRDCSDGSDEVGCVHVCREGQFKCLRTASCIDEELQCDGIDDCGDNSDEFIGCPENPPDDSIPEALDVRLAAPPSNASEFSNQQTYGRVEIRPTGSNQSYGTICHDSWDDLDAAVVCRMLGFSGENAYGYRNAVFGEGEGEIYMSNVRCNGDEQSLLECSSFRWGQVHCRHTHDASVSCGIDMFPDTTTTTMPGNLSTTSSPSVIPTPRTRLVDGSSCMEGRVEVYGGPLGQEYWGNVCDNGFGYQEAYVVCKSLGFDYYQDYSNSLFPSGSLPIVMSYLRCTGDEANLHECDYNGWGSHFCSQYESVGVICTGGNPFIDCEDASEPNVTCDFEFGLCGYTAEDEWTTASNSASGSFLVYNDPFGAEGELARLQSTNFSDGYTKLEFNYRIRQSSYGNLKAYLINQNIGADVMEAANLGTEELLWQSQYLRAEEEGKTLYACVSLDLASDMYSIAFDGVNGPDNTFIELDNINATEGHCVESLLDETCTFDQPSTCGLSVDCTSCLRQHKVYRWWWTEESYTGSFMSADSTYGRVDDEAWMTFAVPNLNNQNSLSFDLLMFGENIGTLAVYLYQGEEEIAELWKKEAGSPRDMWFRSCISLPNSIQPDMPYDIKILATRGLNSTQDISVDNIQLSDDHCPHPITCQEDKELCGWTGESQDEDVLRWITSGTVSSYAVPFASLNSIIRLVDGHNSSSGRVEIFDETLQLWGAVCDDLFGNEDAMVVCRMLGLESTNAYASCCSRFGASPTGRIFLDDVTCSGSETDIRNCQSRGWGSHNCGSSEHVGVYCGPPVTSSSSGYVVGVHDAGGGRGTWTTLLSPEFRYTGGENKFVFNTETVDNGLLKVWYRDIDADEDFILDTMPESEMPETFCADLPSELTGDLQIGITAIKSYASFFTVYMSYMTILPGKCRGNLVQQNGSFESFYTGCAYSVDPAGDECESSSYMWRPISSANDPQFRNVTSGRYLSISTVYGGENDVSSVSFSPISPLESIGACSLKFSYIRTNDGDLQVSVNDVMEILPSFPLLIWQETCIGLPTECGTSAAEIAVSFMATGTTAGLDNLTLSSEPCLSVSKDVSCDFDEAGICGYMTVGNWTQTREGWLNTSSHLSELISPVFTIPADGACIIFVVNFTGYYYLYLESSVVGIEGDKIISRIVGNENSGRQIMDVTLASEQNAILLFKIGGYPGYSPYSISIDQVTLYQDRCENLVLPCTSQQFECLDGECIHGYKRCDARRDCSDASDELNCPCSDREDEFMCESGDYCYNYMLSCDGSPDCSDGSDEIDCNPSLDCMFNESLCGYTMNKGSWQIGSGIVFSYKLGILESATISSTEAKCFSVSAFDPYGTGFMRVILNIEDSYQVIHNATSIYRYPQQNVTLPEGTYSVLIEVQSREYYYTLSYVYGVSFTPGPCEQVSTNTSTTAATTMRSTTSTAPPVTTPPRVSTNTSTTAATTMRSTTSTAPPVTTPPSASTSTSTTAATTMRSTTSTAPPVTTPPSDTPYIVLSPSITVSIGSRVEFSCEVYNTAQNQVFMSWWYTNGTQISYQGDIVLNSNTRFDISYDVTQDKISYSLFIDDVTGRDTYVGYMCKASIPGEPGLILSSETHMRLTEDGCEENPYSYCTTLGFGRLMDGPTTSGLTMIYEARNFLYQYYNEIPEYCSRALAKLACWLHTVQCVDGQPGPQLCRDSCEEIARGCEYMYTIVNHNNTDLYHYCKLLPYHQTDTACEIITEECGTQVALEYMRSDDMQLLSENYPSSTLETSCHYRINGSLGYWIEVTFNDIHGLDCNQGDSIELVDPEGEIDSQSFCTLPSAPIRYSGQFLDITINSDMGAFNVTIKKVVPDDVCDVYNVYTMIADRYHHVISSQDVIDGCSSWILVSPYETFAINLEITSISGGCLEMYDETMILAETGCNLKNFTFLNYVKIQMQPGTEFSLNFSSTYSDPGSSSQYSITNVELVGDSENDGIVVFTRSDGQRGFLCGYMDVQTADIICETLGFSTSNRRYSTYSPPENGLKGLVYDLGCGYYDEDLDSCYIRWNGSCSYCTCTSDYARAVACDLKSESCDFYSSDCGYTFNGGLYIEQYDGVHFDQNQEGAGYAESPTFQYGSGSAVHVTYDLHMEVGSEMKLSLQHANGGNVLWTRPAYRLNGQYQACVDLPESFRDTDVHLMFNYTRGFSQYDSFRVLSHVNVSSERCPDPFPDSPCSLTNLEMCQLILEHPSICTHRDQNVWSIQNGMLYGDSLAVDDIEEEYSFTIDVSSARGNSFTFSYSSNATLFKVVFSSDEIGATDLLTNNEIGTNTSECVDIPPLTATESTSSPAQISFKFTPGRFGGDVAIDDLLISEEKCPHYASCDFERNCGYKFNSTSQHFYWMVQASNYLLIDHTYQQQGKGHVVYLHDDDYYSSTGDTCSFALPDIHLDGNYQCLSLYYIELSSAPAQELYIKLNSSSQIHKEYILPASDVYQTEMEWLQVQIPLNVAGDVGEYITVNIMARDHDPSYRNSFVAIDDIEILPYPCVSGLGDLGVCDFQQPILCHLETGGESGSGYQWTRHIPMKIENDSSIVTDADWNPAGAFMLADSSHGGEGQITTLTFNVILVPTDPASDVYYRFMYYRKSADSGTLLTYHRDTTTETDSDFTILPSSSSGSWQRSPCVPLPADLQGQIVFQAERGISPLGDVAVDNVEIVHGQCSEPTMTCNFGSSDCGYSYHPDQWISEPNVGLHTEQASVMLFPLDSRPTDSGTTSPVAMATPSPVDGCAIVRFSSQSNSPLLVNVTDIDGTTAVHKFVSENGGQKTGRVNIHSSSVRVGLQTPGDLSTTLYSIDYADSLCSPPSCSSSKFQCDDQCIPIDKQCDGREDCYPPTDEEDCGYKLECTFEDVDDNCGYTAAENSNYAWGIEESLSVTLEGNTETLQPARGQMMVSLLTGDYRRSVSSLQSAWIPVESESCITFTYAGTATELSVQATYREDIDSPVWNTTMANLSPLIWRPGRLTLPAGVAQLNFVASAHAYSDVSDDPFMAIDDIQIADTPCTEQPDLACPADYPFVCGGSETCLSQDHLCDGQQHCLDNSDETLDECTSEIGIDCDFETDDLCGYRLSSNWALRPGFLHSTPAYDHTYQNDSGHFLYFSVWSFGDEYYSRSHVGSVQSPSVTFDSDVCISFWYQLNSTRRQPKAYSAQLIVSVNEQVLWYDNVDRMFSTWVPGNVAVTGGVPTILDISAFTSTSSDAWPGIVAIDDISVVPGPCLIDPICDENRYQCAESGVCIPYSWLCDGISDCLQGDDEDSCDRDSGRFDIDAGDGSYGELRYFYDGRWGVVCFPYSTLDRETFDLTVVQAACESKGFKGNFESYQYSLLHRPLSTYELTCVGGRCVASSGYCSGSYAGVRCSNTVCFSGEALCPDTDMECIPKYRVCDGFPDCSNNRDELDCNCRVGDEDGRCNVPTYECEEEAPCEMCVDDRGGFECLNHECIDPTLRCDGVANCADSSDEYQCALLLDDQTAQIFDTTIQSMKPICIDGIGLQEANTLCQLSGQGYVANGGILHGSSMIQDGLTLSATDGEGAISLGNGLYRSEDYVDCFPLVLHCELPACGSTVFNDAAINPLQIHADEVVIGALPYQGLLLRYGEQQCGVSLLNQNWALTAAHCVDTYGTYVVVFGTLNANSIHTQPYAQNISVANIYMNGWTDSLYDGNDIALLQLAHSVNIDDYTRPICLGTEEGLQDILDSGQECIVSGYGYDEYYIYSGDTDNPSLKKTRVGIVPEEECDVVRSAFTERINDDTLCVMNANPYHVSCYGDSGGPLACKNKKGYWELYGVTSFGLVDCYDFYPSMYTSVAQHLQWIHDTMEP